MGNTSCKIDNGKGKKKWSGSKCEVTDCNDGYKQTEDGTCVLSGPCTPNPLVEHAVKYIYNYDGSACVVDTCAQGYIKDGGKCVPVSSGTTSGTSSGAPLQTVAGWNQASLVNFQIFDTYSDTPVGNNYTVETCAAYAKTKGGDAFTFRPSTQGTPAAANTCIGIGYIPNGYTLLGDMIGSTDGITGCVDPAKTWPACGKSTAWCHKTDGVQMPFESDGTTRYILDYSGNRFAPRATLQDIKTAWDSNTTLPNIKSAGYKYAAVTIADPIPETTQTEANYGTYIAWGKTLPPFGSIYTDDGCSYGGSATSSTQYPVGRKLSSYVSTVRKTADTWGGTTWRIYDITQV